MVAICEWLSPSSRIFFTISIFRGSSCACKKTGKKQMLNKNNRRKAFINVGFWCKNVIYSFLFIKYITAETQRRGGAETRGQSCHGSCYRKTYNSRSHGTTRSALRHSSFLVQYSLFFF